MYIKCFVILVDELLCILDNKREITTTSCSRHLPSKNILQRAICIDSLLDIAIIKFWMTNISRKHTPGRNIAICIATSHIRCCELIKIMSDNSILTITCCFCKSFYLIWCNVFSFDNGATCFYGGSIGLITKCSSRKRKVISSLVYSIF